MAFERLRRGYEGVRNHPTTQRIIQHPIVQRPITIIKGAPGGVKTLAAGAGVGMMGGLAATGKKGVGAVRNPSSGSFVLFLALLLWGFDVAIGYKGFNIIDINSLIGFLKFLGSISYIIGAWVLFYFLISQNKSLRNILTYFVAILVIMISIAFAFEYDRAAVFHIAFAIFFWLAFIRQTEESATANLYLITFLIADLYLYSIVVYFSSFIPIFALFANLLVSAPILFSYVAFYVQSRTGNKLALFGMIVVYGYYFITMGPVLAAGLGEAGIDIEATDVPSWREIPGIITKNFFVTPFQKISGGINEWFTGQIQYAITGKVEENQYEPIGVYLENVQSADTRVFEGEDAVVWGTVTARTLDDPIYIQVGCYTKSVVDGENVKLDAKVVDPENKFPVFTLEQQDFACTFGSCQDPESDPNCQLSPGSNSVTAFADFNFESLAYLKTYFIDKERQRAMVREGQDVFEEFDIIEREPVAIYTNGPVAIGMKTTSPLIGVSNSYIVYPRVSLTIQNRVGWEGKIKELKEVVIFFPDGAELVNKEEDCNKIAVPYDLGECTKSCNKFVLEECNSVCDGLSGDAKTSCRASCTESYNKCVGECAFLLEDSGGKYTGWKFTLDPPPVEEDLDEINRVELFSCKFDPKFDKILENTPITTKFFRVKARYNYTVESSVSVRIIDDPATEPSGTGGGSDGTDGGGSGDIIILDLVSDKHRIPPDDVSAQNINVIPAILNAANKFRVPDEVALAIARIENEFRHWGLDGNVITGDGGKSIGAMQIHVIHSGCYDITALDRGICNVPACVGETPYDLECNVKAAVKLILDGKGPLNLDLCVYPEEWEGSARRYNGIGKCAIFADAGNYIEKFRIYRQQYTNLNLLP